MLKPGICFYFEDNNIDVYSGRLIDLDAWRYACKAFGVYTMRVINKTRQLLAMHDMEMDFKEYSSEEEFLADSINDKLIYVECPLLLNNVVKYEELPVFQHPVEGDGYIFYCFGPADGFRPKSQDDKIWITIPMTNLSMVMHSVHAVICVLYDRYLKLR